VTVKEAAQVIRVACQQNGIDAAQQYLQTVQQRLQPKGITESDRPQMTAADMLQLRLASIAAEHALWHEVVMGRHKHSQFHLKSSRRMAKEVLTANRTRMHLLSWSSVKGLWANIDYNGPIPAVNATRGPCWLWNGRKHPDGYGVIRTPKYNVLGQRMKHGAKKMPVYVVMFILDRGRYPRPVCRHRCGNNGCINPRHLTTGTQRDNARDRQKMGQTRGYENATIHSLNQLEAPVTEY